MAAALLLWAAAAGAAEPAPRYPLVPWPAKIEERSGAFALRPSTRITLSDPRSSELREIAAFLQEAVEGATGIRLAVVDKASRSKDRDTVALRVKPAQRGAEGYELTVKDDAVVIEADEPRGLFYGVATLRQLLPQGGGELAIPAVAIEDTPRFRYRGLHLDVGRHFFPVEFIKRYVDLMARYKLNTFHWHLTEDQGWRLEIKRYPKLTEIASIRKQTLVGHRRTQPWRFDGTPHGGFYTQDQIREVVAYAKSRHVTVVPEIEMPGHATAALAAYPELACTAGPFDVVQNWGIYEDIFCPREQTFEFLENVLTEVMELFPSEYIHVGGDEARKTRWEQSPDAQEVIRREGLQDAHELQAWFMRRIEAFLNRHGRKLIGWDEIVEGGLSPTATVMYWRDQKAAPGADLTQDPARMATRAGNNVIMTPKKACYFDYYQVDPMREGQPLAIGGLVTLETVYAYDPVPVDFTPDQARHVIGVQGNVWTEYMKTADHVEYMVYPRALALAEVAWSPAAARDWPSFLGRTRVNLRTLDALNVRYRMP